MSDFTIRVADPTDLDAVTELLEASYPLLLASAYDASLLDAALPAMTRAQPALLASGTYYVAVSPGGRIVGCGGWSRERPGSGETVAKLGHVRHFGTHPDWIRRGVGRALYERCAHDARRAGLARLECYSTLSAEPFYAALGFERVRHIEVAFPSNVEFPGTLMQCWLDAPQV